MRFMSIASGSSGNASYIGSEQTHILVDAGITMKAVSEGLAGLGLSLRDLDAIVLTHEHIDHVRSVGAIQRKYGIPVYATFGTLRELLLMRQLGELDRGCLHPILPDMDFSIGDLGIRPFSISHDAQDPVGYRVACGAKSCAVAMDLGQYDEYILDHLKAADVLLVESNHDIGMLSGGPYPMALKRRILSGRGHLSNDSAGQLLDAVLHPDIRHVFLGHLSEENNQPDLALRTVRREIDSSESSHRSKDVDITVAERHRPSEIIEF